jgi:Rho family protein
VDEDGQPIERPPMIDYDQGLAVARRIHALRYLGMSLSTRELARHPI